MPSPKPAQWPQVGATPEQLQAIAWQLQGLVDGLPEGLAKARLEQAVEDIRSLI